MKKEKEIYRYSDEVRDVLSHPPKTIIVWGNTIILGFILILLLLLWFIKYPEIVRTNVIITTEIPPEKLVSKTTGKIESIFIKDKDFVLANTPLAIIENSAKYQDVLTLKKLLKTINITNENIEFPLELTSMLQLGAIESAYSNFEKSYLEYSVYKNHQPYLIDKESQKFEQKQQELRLQLLLRQKEISDKELVYKKTELERHKNLFEKGVIPVQEWETKNIEYLQHQKSINDLASQITMLYSSLNDLDKNKKNTILNESKDHIKLKSDLILCHNQLKKAISDWELDFLIQASIKGQVSFLKIWKENQNITVGENVFVIIPESNSFVGKIKAPALNSGKIKEGQMVNVRLTNYPDREYGVVKGQIKSVSLIPDQENNLLIDINLPNGLRTSYNRQLLFQQEMVGTADIITEDLRLIERLLYQFRDLFKR